MLFALLACTGATDSADTATKTDTADTATASGPGTLALRFALDDDLPADMDEPPVGVFSGSIYAEGDASAVGPNDGATSLVDFESAALDFTVSLESEVAWTSDPIDAQIIWILGCLDSDANGCDTADAVTIPNDNKLQVVADVETAFTVQLNILSP